MSRRSIPRTCETCGKDFLAAKCDVAKGWGRFCSRECKCKGLTDPDKGSPEWKKRHAQIGNENRRRWRASLSGEQKRTMNKRSYDARNKHRKPLALIQAERIAKADRTKKICTKCSIEQPIANFMRHPTAADKRCTECKTCFYKRRKKWRTENRDKVLAASKRRYWRDPEKCRAQTQRCRPSVEKSRAYQRSRYAKDPRKFAGYANKRRMKKLGIPGSHTHKEWLTLCKRFGYRCVCCGEKRPLTKDHVVPISNPMSSDSIQNLQPLCLPCNASKGNRNTIDYRATPFLRKGQATLFG